MLRKWLKKFRKVGLIFLGIGGVLLFYTVAIEPGRLVLHEETITINHWDKSLNGFKVVAISDIHGGAIFMDETKLRQIVELSNAQNPDIIVLLGDYVSQSEGRGSQALKMPTETLAQNLVGFKAKYGVFGVIGNHDWWFDEKIVRREFENIGVKILENETFQFQVKDKLVQIIGIEDFWKKHKVDQNLIDAKITNESNVIGITHNPDTFSFTSDKISVMFAGHSHGGQVKFPFIGAPIVPSKKEFTAGHILKDGRNLFVTTGIGTSGLPVRFMVPPEIAVITLNGQNQ